LTVVTLYEHFRAIMILIRRKNHLRLGSYLIDIPDKRIGCRERLIGNAYWSSR
jgi:hypothetical protein